MLLSSLFAFSSIIVIVVGLVRLRSTAKTCQGLKQHCGDEWSNLQACLSSRHLIVSHMLDSLRETSSRNILVDKLDSAHSDVINALSQFDSREPSCETIRRIGRCESEMLSQLRETIQRIKPPKEGSRADAPSGTPCSQGSGTPGPEGPLPAVEPLSKTMQACLDGIDQSNVRVEDACSTYNSAVITYHEHLETSLARVLLLLGPPPKDYCAFSFSWSGTDSDTRPRG